MFLSAAYNKNKILVTRYLEEKKKRKKLEQIRLVFISSPNSQPSWLTQVMMKMTISMGNWQTQMACCSLIPLLNI